MLDMTTIVDGEERPAVLFVPADFDSDRAYPLIVFLHGSGERGDDGWFQTEFGVGTAIRRHPERFDCLVFIPQCPSGMGWSWNEGGDGQGASLPHVTNGIEKIQSNFNIDADRVSLTGLSMGGFGTFAYGAVEWERFSAFMAVCGGGDPGGAEGLARRPMRVYHGDADRVVAIERSREMVEAIEAAGGDVKFTVYPGVGHNSWDAAYGIEEGAVEWLLEQRR
jgi:predicted peptidase